VNLFGRSKIKIYKHHLKWTDEFVKNNIHLIEKNYSLDPYKNKWSCNVHTVHDYEIEDVYMIDYGFLRKQYERIVQNVVKKFDMTNYHLSDIWYNYYKEGQYQEPHIHHGNGGITAVHYLIFNPKYHSLTHFSDSNIKSPRIRSGDIIFFPDDAEHYVPMNKTDKPRLTTAFTVTRED
jgi:hypothetical protein